MTTDHCRCPSIACVPHDGVDCRCQSCEVGADPVLARLHRLTRRAALARRPLPVPTSEPPDPHWSDR